MLKQIKKDETYRENFIRIVAESVSIRQVLNKLGIVEAGGNYASFYVAIKYLNLSTDHFKGIAANSRTKP